MIVVIIACIFIVLASFTPLIVIGIFNLKHKFYYDSYKKHTSLEVNSDNEKWSRLPITHDSSLHNFTKLKRNPNKHDSRDSYISNKVIKTSKHTRRRRLNNLKIRSLDDVETIQNIIDSN